MKGVVFTEFLDFVGQQFGEDAVDDIIGDCELASGGAYTSVGTYDHREMHALVSALAVRTAQTVPQLLVTFGRHLCGRFASSHPDFFARTPGLFDFLESVHRHIHVEVRKLYPDAELPTFETYDRTPERLFMNYRSCRPLSALAEGLILGAADHYGNTVKLHQEPGTDANGSFVRFQVQLMTQS